MAGPQTDLAGWLGLPAEDRPRLIDVRSEAAFESRRLVPSTCLPAEDLVDLLFELPETTTPLALVASTAAEGESVLSVLQEKGWLRIEFLFCVDEEDGFWGRAEAEEGLTASGPVRPIDRVVAYTPQPFLANQIETIEAGLAAHRPLSDDWRAGGAGAPRWQCCDVGCGSGRDAVWLAKRGRWAVRAVDRLPRCLDRVRALSLRHGVGEHVLCEEATIKSGVVVSSSCAAQEEGASFEERQYDLVLVVRFLERAFNEALHKMVCPGGFLLFVSFVAMEGIVYESPKDPRRLLERCELSRVFGPDGYGLHVVRDEVMELPDGRFVSAFLAQAAS